MSTMQILGVLSTLQTISVVHARGLDKNVQIETSLGSAGVLENSSTVARDNFPIRWRD